MLILRGIRRPPVLGNHLSMSKHHYPMNIRAVLCKHCKKLCNCLLFFSQAEDGIRDYKVTGVQTCALPICKYSTTTPAKTICHVSWASAPIFTAAKDIQSSLPAPSPGRTFRARRALPRRLRCPARLRTPPPSYRVPPVDSSPETPHKTACQIADCREY